MGGRYAKFWLPWLVGMPAETATAILTVLMGGVLQRFPRLKLCFAHGGGSFPYTAGRIGKQTLRGEGGDGGGVAL